MRHTFIISYLWMFGLCISLGTRQGSGHALVPRAPPNPSTPSGRKSTQSRSQSPNDLTASLSRSPSPDNPGRHREPIRTGLSPPLAGLSVDDPVLRFKRPSESLPLPLSASGRSSSPSSTHPSLFQQARPNTSHGQPSPKRARMGLHSQLQVTGNESLQQSTPQGRRMVSTSPQQTRRYPSPVAHVGPDGQMIYPPTTGYLGSWLQGRTPEQQKRISRSLSALVQEAVGQPTQSGTRSGPTRQEQHQQPLLRADSLATPFSSPPQRTQRQQRPLQHDTPMSTPRQASIPQPSSLRPEPIDTPMPTVEHRGMPIVQSHVEAARNLVNDHSMATYAHQQQSMQHLAELRRQRNVQSQQFYSDFGSFFPPGLRPENAGQNWTPPPPYLNQNPKSGG